MATTLGDSIRIARLRRGWTRRTLAEASGIGERTVWRIEVGGLCYDKTAVRLAEALDLDVESTLRLWYSAATNATGSNAKSDGES